MNTPTKAEANLSVDDVAERLKVEAQTVRRWIASGKLRASKLSGVWRTSDAAVQEFIDDNSNTPSEPPCPTDG